jgi:hypothetical protein
MEDKTWAYICCQHDADAHDEKILRSRIQLKLSGCAA